jgi:glycosyltransferase involved in cell wall biosynthesis
VVQAFRASLPQAEIYVYDNNSSDDTALIAREAGAIVRSERRQGKGYVVRRMFADIDADVYVLVDGDATYEAAAAPRLVSELLAGPYDKVNGARVETSKTAYRGGHAFGNKLLSGLVALVFGAQSRDMLSGYKAFSRRFVKTFPSTSSGFEIETELLIHSLEIDAPMSEIETSYRERPAGSFSKLSTFKDGARILWLIVELIRDLMPLQFFAAVATVLACLSILLGIPVIDGYIETGLVPRLPTAVLALGIMLLAFIAFFTGLTLDSVSRGRREAKMIAYLGYSSPGRKGEVLSNRAI